MQSTLNITTLAKVKDLIRQADPVTSEVDNQLNRLIAIVSRRAEERMKRGLLKEERTEVFDVEAGQRVFIVAAPPIDIAEDVTVKNAADRDFTGGTTLDTSDLAVYNDETGRVKCMTDLAEGPRTLQITYTGGMGEDQDDLITNYPELAELAALQVYTWWKQLPSVGKTSEGVIGVQYASYREMALIEDFEAVLASLEVARY